MTDATSSGRDATDVQIVGVSEAAQLLGVTRRTVQRWVKHGDLKGTMVEGQWQVEVPLSRVRSRPKPSLSATVATDDTIQEAVRQRDDLARRIAEMSLQLRDKERQIDDLKQDRDHWREEAERTSIISAQMTATIRQLTETKALPAPHKRVWWRFWERDEEAKGEG